MLGSMEERSEDKAVNQYSQPVGISHEPIKSLNYMLPKTKNCRDRTPHAVEFPVLHVFQILHFFLQSLKETGTGHDLSPLFQHMY